MFFHSVTIFDESYETPKNLLFAYSDLFIFMQKAREDNGD
jgi:hypothetical protein